MQTDNQPIIESPKRPQFLTVICILSFIFSGIGIIFLLFGIFGVLAAKSAGIDLSEKMAEMGTDQVSIDAAAAALSIPSLVISIVLTIISLIGVIMMWKLKKTGFFVYTGTQVIALIVPIFFSGMAGFSFVGLFFTALFIVLFGLNLKHMR